jgi:formylglycine-generating enzyme required for sulfatase activity
MVKLPAGAYVMGLGMPHQVSVPSFYMSRYTVTQDQWRRVAGYPKVAIELNPSPSYFKGGRRPVERISWEDAMEFCKRLSLATGRPYRLPSESEWEYACRAGTTTPFHFGETIAPEWVNYNGGHPYGDGPQGIFRGETVEVGSLGGANAFGLYDMHGNVWEWCADQWHDDYLGAPADGGIWDVGGDVRLRVIRGGAFQYFASVCCSYYRFQSAFDKRLNNLGLRIVASIPRYNRAIGDSRGGQ